MAPSREVRQIDEQNRDLVEETRLHAAGRLQLRHCRFRQYRVQEFVCPLPLQLDKFKVRYLAIV